MLDQYDRCPEASSHMERIHEQVLHTLRVRKPDIISVNAKEMKPINLYVSSTHSSNRVC